MWPRVASTRPPSRIVARRRRFSRGMFSEVYLAFLSDVNPTRACFCLARGPRRSYSGRWFNAEGGKRKEEPGRFPRGVDSATYKH